MEPHNCWTPNSLLFGTTKPATSKLSLKLPTYSQQGLGYFAFAPVVDVEPSFDSEDASLAKQAEERRLRDEEEQKKRDEELAREWQLEEERRLQRRAREAEEARRGEECWVRSGGVLRDANGKRDMVRTQAIRDELKLREEEKLLMDRWKCYEADWAELLEQVKLSASRTIKFRDIPWPIDLTDRNTLTPQLLQPFAKRLAVSDFENKQNKTNPIVGFTSFQPSCNRPRPLQRNALPENLEGHQDRCYASIQRQYTLKDNDPGLSQHFLANVRPYSCSLECH